MAAGQVVEIGQHAELMARPDGAYAKLVAAQQYTADEEVQDEVLAGADPEADARDEKAAGALARQRSFADEKPGMKRTLTGRSAASAALSDKKVGLQAHGKSHSFFQLFVRMGKINSNEWPLLLLGTFGAIVSGMICASATRVLKLTARPGLRHRLRRRDSDVLAHRPGPAPPRRQPLRPLRLHHRHHRRRRADRQGRRVRLDVGAPRPQASPPDVPQHPASGHRLLRRDQPHDGRADRRRGRPGAEGARPRRHDARRSRPGRRHDRRRCHHRSRGCA